MLDILKQLGTDQSIFIQFGLIVGFYIITKFLFLKHLQNVLDLRDEKTSKLEGNTEKQFEEIEKIQEAYNEKISKANKDLRLKFDESKNEITKKHENFYREEETKTSTIIEKSKKEVQAEIETKKQAVLSEAESLANSLVSKLTTGAVAFLCFTNFALAAGSGHGSPVDLIPAAVNVVILICGIIYLIRTPLKSFFKNESKTIKEKIESASVKAAEAKALMEEQQKKINGVDAEVKSLENDIDDQIKAFDREYQKEILARVEQLKLDADQKVSAEKNQLINELNSKLLDEVISKTKNIISADKGLSATAAKKVIEGQA